MFRHALFVALCCLVQTQAVEKSPRIIIVGCGVSGIAAATRLMQNGFDNITIIEAENRIGGRVYTTPFAGYVVDLGGQWVHGEEDNISYELAWPLGLLEHSVETTTSEIFDSTGSLFPRKLGNSILEYHLDLASQEIPDAYLNKSIGDFYKPKLEEFLRAQPDLTEKQRKSLMDLMHLSIMGLWAGDNWFNLSVHREDVECNGDQSMNWKERGYGTILDILMRRYPDPSEELPVLNKTVLNTEVSQIDYSGCDGNVRVKTSNGDEYFADHVIVTPSIAVLKADYKTLFNPQLPETKINAIKGIELGAVVKIFLSYPHPWWTSLNNSVPTRYYFQWRDEDKNEYARDPEKRWMLGLGFMIPIDHKPKLMCAWVTGPQAREMENIPDDRVFVLVKQFIRRFMGKTYNLTEPNEMLRSKWFGNKHFRGTWSYRSLNTERLGAKAHHLAEPIMANGNPVVLFAGEATHSTHPSTVHGAIGSGWREANRIMELYPDRRSIPKISHWGEQFWQIFNEDKTMLRRRLSAGEWQTVAAKKKKSS